MTQALTTLHMLTRVTATACNSITGGNACDSGLPKSVADGSTIPSILTILFAVIGALCVLMIVIAGMRFVTSSGNPQETAKAKNTIIYALVGLLIALAAESIVNFVMGNL
jgi:beta-lactamase regulating signal transducer with metallopeptidase domain